MTTDNLTLLEEMIELHRRVTEYEAERRANGQPSLFSGVGTVTPPPGLSVAGAPVKRGRGRPRKNPDPQLAIPEQAAEA